MEDAQGILPPHCCPYCNAVVPIPPGTAAGQKLPCPRCGELFPFRSAPLENNGAPTPPSEPALAPRPSSLTPRSRWSNRTVGLLILGGMAVMAAIGLIFALWTVQERRGHDFIRPRSEIFNVPLPLRFALGIYLFVLAFILARGWFQRVRATEAETGVRSGWRRFVVPLVLTLVGVALLMFLLRPRPNPEPEPEPLTPVRAVPPTELSGLGYLPNNVNLIVGLHLAEALETPAGKELFLGAPDRGTRPGPRLGPLDLSPARLAQWTELKPEEIDHILLGANVSETFPPPLTLVLVARKPFDQNKILDHLEKGHPDIATAGKALHNRRIDVGLPLEAQLWFAEPRTLVVFYNVPAKQIQDIPEEVPSGVAGMREPAKSLVSQARLGEQAQAWLTARPQTWPASLKLILQFRLPREESAIVSQVRFFGLALQMKESVVIHGAFECDDAAAARNLEARLGVWQGTPAAFEVATAIGLSVPLDEGPLRALVALVPARADSWVQWQDQFSVDEIQKRLGGIKLDLSKLPGPK